MAERPPFPRSLLVLGVLAAAGPAQAGEWTITPRVELEEYYSDNIFLQDKDEEDDFVTAVNPGLHIQGQGRHAMLDLDYRMENLAYLDHDKYNQTNHQLSSKAKLELVPEYFYLDGVADVGQRAVSLNNVRFLDNVSITDNRVDYEYLSLSPYLLHDFGGLVRTELRYRVFQYDDHFQERDVSTGDLPTANDGDSVRAVLASGGEFVRMQWSLSFDRYTQDHAQGLDFSNTATAGEDRRESTNASVSYMFTESWSAIFRSGNQQNEIGGVERANNGSYWAAGLGWQPNREFGLRVLGGDADKEIQLLLTPTERTDFQLTWRKMDVGTVVGPTWNLQASHKTRHSNWSASFEESLVSQQQLVLEGREPRIIINPRTGRPEIVRIPIYGLDDENFRREYGTFAVEYELGRNRISSRVFHEKRTYELHGEQDETVVGLNFGIDFGLGAHSVLAVSTDLDRRQFENLDRDEDFYTLRTAWRYTLSPKAKFELSLAHTIREDDGEDAQVFRGDSLEYTENRVLARLTKEF